MKKIFLMAIVLASAWILNPTARAAELITNGGFETGNFTGWTATNASGPFQPWQVSTAGAGGFYNPPFATTPPEGTRDAWQGTASTANSPFTLDQQFTIPVGVTASITWRHRFQANLSEFCGHAGQIACGTVIYSVQILNTANTVLQTLYTRTALANVNTDTGWQYNLRNLNAFVGQAIKIRFRTIASVTFDGPGQLEVDAVSIQTPAVVTAAAASISGRLLTAGGLPVNGGMVTLTDGPNVRTALSNPFGYYRFDEIATGRTYVLGATSKRYFFPNSPVALSVSG
ncbi:MAG: hypothetical protein ABIP75_08620, partial [Pyrinomonadaceae bacterium]